MIVKVIRDFNKRMETRIDKMQEMFNNDLKDLKNKQTNRVEQEANINKKYTRTKQ